MTVSLTPLPVRHRLSHEFLRLAEVCRNRELTYQELLTALRVRGNSVITLFFALPFMLPVPMPGLSLLFGAIIFYMGLRIGFGREPWIPQKWGQKIAPSALLLKVFITGARWMVRLEKFIKPRGKFFATHAGTKTFTGIAIAMCGFFLALPLPPGTNFPPATAIILLSLGNLEEDGLLLSVGYLVFAANVALFIGLPIFGFEKLKTYFGL